MKINHIIIAFLLLQACDSPVMTVDVDHVGELRQIMHQGKIEARVSLDSITRPGLYAVGALDSLRGEILIENGHSIIATVDSIGPSILASNQVLATLLVYSTVHEWDTMVVTTSNLEKVLESIASDKQLNTPFPFVIQGKFPKLMYHIINFDPNSDFSQHKKGAYIGELTDQVVTITGFYSDHHQGIFTHHDSRVHMHVRNEDFAEMGHVDELETGTNSFTLLLPKL